MAITGSYKRQSWNGRLDGIRVGPTHVIVQVTEERNIGSNKSKAGDNSANDPTSRNYVAENILYSPVVLVVLQKFMSEEELYASQPLVYQMDGLGKYSPLN